ncbi:hypothetical protein ACIOD0_04990 [Kitasatospora albolonga]|uniref:Pyruvate carboxyltransferase domain-containing protein n=1 Tax=Streptomyces stephensoniae TaxID=3375367 RepID=A0ABU2VZN8_9ACTN|nr:hypothetical protein [Streptomyces griseus]MDT0491070.1 hypothetical protein [Streptomyces griseus]
MTTGAAPAAERVVLDCTLRDGGYYTNWEFDTALVRDYLALCPRLGVNVVELGYVRFHEGNWGPYGDLPGALTQELAGALPDGHGLRFAVMVDAADFAGLPPGKVGQLLADKLVDSAIPVDLVRVAVRYNRVAGCVEAVQSLREAGFGVCLNLMQIDLASEEETDACVGAAQRMGPLEALYLADSLGSLRPARTARLVRRLATGVGAPVGIHAHENQGFALHNTLVAQAEGATWLDGTVHGMGRGAGNTRTEELLAALGAEADTLQPLQELIVRHFLPLMERYRWGAGGLYGLAGLHHVHPTYVQRLEESLGQDQEAKIRAMDFLAKVPSASFTAALLESAEDHARG